MHIINGILIASLIAVAILGELTIRGCIGWSQEAHYPDPVCELCGRALDGAPCAGPEH